MARKAVTIDSVSKDFGKFFGDFGEAIVVGSPMACALVATSVVENALMTLLITFFKHGTTTEELFKSPGGLLGDFFNCTKIAYCIGLIPKQVKANLETVGQIRNTFAHSTCLIAFDSPEIVVLCKKLSLPKGIEEKTYPNNEVFNPHRLQFTLVCALLCQHLFAYARIYAKPLVECRENLKNEFEW